MIKGTTSENAIFSGKSHSNRPALFSRS